MKRCFLLFLPFILFACNSQQADQGNKPLISVSVLPQKYFIEQIAGDLVEVNVMIPPGASPATYEPSVLQLQNLKKSLAYMRIGYIGFELAWMDKIQSAAADMPVYDLSEGVELIQDESHNIDRKGNQSEQVRGNRSINIQEDHLEDPHNDHSEGQEEGHSEGQVEDHSGHQHYGTDPHIWLSPKNAGIIAKNIYDALALSIPDKRETFYKNYILFLEKTDSLDTYIREELSLLEQRAFICYHPSLTYFAKDYNIIQLPIELEGKAPSSAHLKRIIDLGRQEGIEIILLQKQFDQHNAKVIAEEIGARIVLIDPLDSQWYDQMVYITKKLKAGTDE